MMTGGNLDSTAPNDVSTARYAEGLTEAAPTLHTEWPPVTAAVRRNMQANRGSDTQPELALRRRLHRAGLRYRVNLPLPFDRRRRADITFTSVGLYVFVDGCFWHGCPDHYVKPKTRDAFWRSKVEANRRRDLETTQRLQELGFTVMRFWEHEPVAATAALIEAQYRRLREDKS